MKTKVYNIIDALGNTQFSWSFLRPIIFKAIIRVLPFLLSAGWLIEDMPCI